MGALLYAIHHGPASYAQVNSTDVTCKWNDRIRIRAEYTNGLWSQVKKTRMNKVDILIFLGWPCRSAIHRHMGGVDDDLNNLICEKEEAEIWRRYYVAYVSVKQST